MIPPLLLIGTITEVVVADHADGLPRTHVTLQASDTGRRVTFTVPGANGGPPLRVGGVPAFTPGETWLVELDEAPVGLVPVGLGAGLTRLDAADSAPPPPWALNGLTYSAAELPLEIYLNETGSADIGVDATEAVVQRALEAWSGVGCATFAFSYAGRTSAGLEDDGLNVLSWEDTEWVWGASVAGFSATRFGTDEGGAVIPVGADIVFNGVDWLWTTEPGDAYDRPARLNADSVVLHELGHVTGMDHELALVASTMFFAYIGGDWQGSLAGDDRRGLCENYPSGTDECVTDKDCLGLDDQPRTCRALDGISVCDEVRDVVGDACSRTHFNCAAYCIFTDRQATDGYCSVGCDGDEDCPDGYRCDSPELFLYDDPDTEERLCVQGEAGTDTAPPDSAAPDTEDDTPGDGGKDRGCTHAPRRSPGPGAVLLAGLIGLGWGRRRTERPFEGRRR